jgi:hypothetical protein
MGTYGRIELLHASAFANALASDNQFAVWVLRKTKFANLAVDSRLLHEEMWARRTATTWWRSHFNPKCGCFGCVGGKETDLLAIFEARSKARFALHIEVKHDKDKFTKGRNQAAAYPVRAQCWATVAPPQSVLPHTEASTALLCSRNNLKKLAPDLPFFDTVFTFEDVGAEFPNAVARA